MTVKPESKTFLVLLTSLVAIGPISTDLYLPSLPSITRAFNVGVSEAQMTLSAFLVGFAFMQLVYGPLSDRFGRRPVLLWGFAIFVVASGLCLLATTIEQLILGRFLQSIGACCGPVLGRAVVRDVYGRERAAHVLAYVTSAVALAPAVAPTIGGLLESAFGWQANFSALALVGLLIFLATYFLLDETNASKDPHALRPVQLAANFLALFRDRRFLGYALTLSLTFSALFSFISVSSFVVIDILGILPSYFGYNFCVAVVGFMSGSFLSGRFAPRLGVDRVILTGVLLGIAVGTVILVLALMGIVSWFSVMLPMYFVFMSCGLTLPTCMAGAISPFPHMAGAASSLAGFVQMAVGSLAGFLVGKLYDGTTLPLMGMICLCSYLALAVYWFVLRPVRETPTP
jgi:DHA1 family bicyclomycin/chloramphenicol resistance-like MFS transporter